ncbi:MAG: hypothetical protein WA373_14720 [Burkholderiales bacterium]
MSKNWIWVVKYLVVIAVALVLGAVLGNLGLFKSATLGTPKLTAASLAQFFANAGALTLLWLLGLRLAHQLRDSGGSAANLSRIVLSLVTLIVTASAYVVLLLFFNPFISRDLKPFIDWAFILGTLAAAIWLVWALFTDSEALMEAIGRAASDRKKSKS